jgi:hypothetical protein
MKGTTIMSNRPNLDPATDPPTPGPVWRISDPVNPAITTNDPDQIGPAVTKRAAGLELNKLVTVERVL